MKGIGKEVRPSQKIAIQTYSTLTSGNDSPKAFCSKLWDQSKLVYPEADVSHEARVVPVKTQYIQALPTNSIEEVAKQANPHSLTKNDLLEICTRVWEATIKARNEMTPSLGPVCALQPHPKDHVAKLEQKLSDVKQLLSKMSTQLATIQASQLSAAQTNIQPAAPPTKTILSTRTML